MFELAQAVGLWGSQNFVKDEAKDLCKDKICSFFVFLALSSVICRPVHFFNTSCELKVLIKKGLIKKIYLGKHLVEQLFNFTLDAPP